ncbi:MAG TPA: protein kinase [Planctomycetota bacterium]|nr:protein kinase [Planctomycetota bacterium]
MGTPDTQGNADSASDAPNDGMTLVSSKPVGAQNPAAQAGTRETVIKPKEELAIGKTVVSRKPAEPIKATTSADEMTMIQTPTGGSDRPSKPPSRTPSSHGGSSSSNYSGVGKAVSLSVAEQDLSGEGLLQQAPRIDFNGRPVPSLGGIPLIAKLGQGGMGAVYYGIHPGLQIEVAVKVLPLALAQPEAIQRFYREAQIAAKIQSPHLVAVRDVNQEHGLYYLVMEYINGMTSGGYMKKLKEQGTVGLPERDALSICIAATEGLAVAHNAAIIHRDIKPDNILVPTYRGKPELDFDSARLSDLGLARQEQGEGLTVTAVGLGTAGYMAPEQAMNARTVGKAADIWSMGATLYALLAGRAPFKGDTPVNTIVASVQDPHEPITNMRNDVSEVTSALIDCCLDKKPEGRFPDGSALLEGLKICRDVLGQPESVQKEALQALAQLQKASEKGEKVVGVEPVGASKHFNFQKKKDTGSSKTLIIVGAAAVVVLVLGIVGMVVLGKKGGGNGEAESAMMKKLAEMEAKLQAREQELATQAKKREEELERMMKLQEEAIAKRLADSKKQLEEEKEKLKNDPKAKEKELAIESLGFAGAMASEGKLEDAQKHLDEAAKVLNADYPLVVAMRQTIEQKREAVAKAAAEAKRKQLVDELRAAMASLDKGGDLSEVSVKVAAGLKAYPQDPEMISLNERLDRKRSDIEKNQQQQKAAGERATALAKANEFINKADFASAEKKIAELEQKFGVDTQTQNLHRALEAKKQEEGRKAAEEAKRIAEEKKAVERTSLLKDIETLLDTKANEVTDAEKKLAEFDSKFPGDAAAKPVRDRFAARKKEIEQRIAEQKKAENLAIAIQDIDAAFKSNADLPTLQNKIAAAEKFGTNDALAAFKQKVAAKAADLAAQQQAEKKRLEEEAQKKRAEEEKLRLQQEQRASFDGYIRGAEAIIAKGDFSKNNIQKIEDSLKAAERLFPTDPAVAELKQKFESARHKSKPKDESSADTPKSTTPAKKKRIGEENVD